MTSEVQIERIEHFIGSSDGTSQLRVLLWIPYLPENELKGIVQIVHGMEEHIDRYDEIEIPWKAGTNSANSKRTPAINTYKPVTNCNACKNMNTM